MSTNEITTIEAKRDALGLVWRPLQVDDTEALGLLIAACEEKDNPGYRTSEAETRRLFDPQRTFTVVGGFDPGGVLRAFAHVLIRGTTHVEALCKGAVDPLWRSKGIGPVNMRWQVAVAREMLLAYPEAESRRVSVHVEDARVNIISYLERLGYERTTSYTEWRRDLCRPIRTVATSPYLMIVPWNRDLDPLVLDAYNAIIVETGRSPIDAARWERDKGDFEPAWTFVALDRSRDRARVAGFVFSSRYEQDWDALGWTEGYVDYLAVLPDWSDTEVGMALICRVMEAFAAAGMDRAAIDVQDAKGSHLADELRDLGFRASNSTAVYTIHL